MKVTIVANRCWGTNGGSVESGTEIADIELRDLPIVDADGKQIRTLSPSVRLLADGIANGLFGIKEEPARRPVEPPSPETITVTEVVDE
jgi:hypothetical protein